MRDLNLKEGTTFDHPEILAKFIKYDGLKINQKKVPCHVHRISAYLKGVTNEDIRDEIGDFYYDVKNS